MSEQKQPGEIQREWESFDRSDRRIIVRVHCNKTGYRDQDYMFRIYELAKPSIILGKKDGVTYCRIAKESEELLTILINNYA